MAKFEVERTYREYDLPAVQAVPAPSKCSCGGSCGQCSKGNCDAAAGAGGLAGAATGATIGALAAGPIGAGVGFVAGWFLGAVSCGAACEALAEQEVNAARNRRHRISFDHGGLFVLIGWRTKTVSREHVELLQILLGGAIGVGLAWIIIVISGPSCAGRCHR